MRRLGERVVVPGTIKERAEKTFGEFIEALGGFYDRMIESRVPKEDARFILPNATETSLFVTMDCHALLHFLGLRYCNRAQWEIRAVADGMLTAVRALEPDIFRGAGPYCFQLGYCPEGRFTCGRMKEVAEKYRPLNEG